MNRTDVISVLAILRGAFPQFYRDITKKEAEDTVGLWCDMFREDDSGLVGAAVKAFIAGDEKGFPPTIGQIKAKMRLLTDGGRDTEQEAWNAVAKAVKNSAYGAAEEFTKLPPILQRIVGTPGQLREWAMMDSQTLHSVVASNFQRSYRAISEREKEVGKLPPEVREMVQSLSAGRPTEMPEAKKEKDFLPALEAQRREEWERARESEESKKRRNADVIAQLKKGGK